MSAPPWTPEKNITMKKVLRSTLLLEVNLVFIETYKALLFESDLFPVHPTKVGDTGKKVVKPHG